MQPEREHNHGTSSWNGHVPVCTYCRFHMHIKYDWLVTLYWFGLVWRLKWSRLVVCMVQSWGLAVMSVIMSLSQCHNFVYSVLSPVGNVHVQCNKSTSGFATPQKHNKMVSSQCGFINERDHGWANMLWAIYNFLPIKFQLVILSFVILSFSTGYVSTAHGPHTILNS